MKKFVVHLNYYATVDVEVMAENEEEAKTKAEKKCIDPSGFDFSLNERSVLDSVEVDLEALTGSLKETVRRYAEDHQGAAMAVRRSVKCEVSEVWNGSGYVAVQDTVSGLSWDALREVLLVSFEHSEDMEFDELADTDRYAIADMVLHVAGTV